MGRAEEGQDAVTEETKKATEKKGGGPLALALPALLAGAVALGVSYLDPFGGEGAHAAEAHAAGTPTEKATGPKGKSAKKSKGKGKDAEGGSGLLILDPMIVSLVQSAPGRAGPRLRIAVALRAPGGADETQTLLLRDGLTAAVHAMTPDVLAGPDGLAALRAALLEAARGVLGEEAVEGVLITDYVLI